MDKDASKHGGHGQRESLSSNCAPAPKLVPGIDSPLGGNVRTIPRGARRKFSLESTTLSVGLQPFRCALRVPMRAWSVPRNLPRIDKRCPDDAAQSVLRMLPGVDTPIRYIRWSDALWMV